MLDEAAEHIENYGERSVTRWETVRICWVINRERERLQRRKWNRTSNSDDTKICWSLSDCTDFKG